MSEIEWKVGARVQDTKNNTIRVGVITAIETAEEEKTRYNYEYSYSRQESYTETVIKSMTVKWDDGEEATVSEYDVSPEDSEMERAFRLLSEETQKRINEKLSLAHVALREAQQISEETGVPFGSGISPLGQDYIPHSLENKFPGLDKEFVNGVTDTYGEYGGWQHSAVC